MNPLRLKKNSLIQPIEYIQYVHKEFLSKICKESGFEGLDYFGGPEVKCDDCGELSVLRCVEYGREDVRQTDSCEIGCTKFNINNLLVCL